jgi:hypothetical protein
MHQFETLKELKKWFSGLSVEEKRASGKLFNELKKKFDAPKPNISQYELLRSKLVLNLEEKETLDDYHTCQKCGYFQWDCKCWKLMATKCDVFKVPIGMFFIMKESICIKNVIDRVENQETGEVFYLDYLSPLGLEFEIL